MFPIGNNDVWSFVHLTIIKINDLEKYFMAVKVAQQVKKFDTKSDNLWSKSRTHMIERKPTPTSCHLTS